jgi:hypothetical protein
LWCVCEDRALLCSGFAETDRFGRSAGQTAGRETSRKEFTLLCPDKCPRP